MSLPSLDVLALRVGAILRERGQTVAVAESSSGGLVSAALLSVPGASAFFVGGAVIYTQRARQALLGLSDDDMHGIRAETERYAEIIARRARVHLGSTWGLGESGAAGPKGSPYGDAPGHVCVAISGATLASQTFDTGLDGRAQNMDLFARHLLSMFEERLGAP